MVVLVVAWRCHPLVLQTPDSLLCACVLARGGWSALTVRLVCKWWFVVHGKREVPRVTPAAFQGTGKAAAEASMALSGSGLTGKAQAGQDRVNGSSGSF